MKHGLIVSVLILLLANVAHAPVTRALATPSLGLAGMTRGPDGNVWFVETLGNRIGRITPSGVVTEFQIPTHDSRPYAIVEGPGGALWFTETYADKIARLTPAGAFTDFQVPAAAYYPVGLTVGTDNALWFTTEYGMPVGRMTAQGDFQFYSVPVGTGTYKRPINIISAPDGRLWMTEFEQNSIAALALAGTVPTLAHSLRGSSLLQRTLATVTGITQTLTLPKAASNPIGLTNGPDGAIWFTEQGSDRIGRIDGQRHLREFALPHGVGPYAITSGPDTALWFTEGNANSIGRISNETRITQLPLPQPDRVPADIINGPDGHLWMTEQGVNCIGRLSVQGTLQEFAVTHNAAHAVPCTRS